MWSVGPVIGHAPWEIHSEVQDCNGHCPHLNGLPPRQSGTPASPVSSHGRRAFSETEFFVFFFNLPLLFFAMTTSLLHSSFQLSFRVENADTCFCVPFNFPPEVVTIS